MKQPDLPIDEVIPRILDALREQGAVALTAPPGAGKTTRVPQAILDARITSPDQEIIVLEPRRMAARACAHTMARLRKEGIGETVGYQVRFESRRSTRTRILVVTEGILTRRLLDDPLLEGVGCVVLDEFHERSIHTDLALAFLKELREARPELKIVVMSATMDGARISSYLGSCTNIESPGRLYPLRIDHVSRPDDRPLPSRVAAAVGHLLGAPDDDGNDILVFLPGAPEIRRVSDYLMDLRLPGSPRIVPLHGTLSAQEQDAVLQESTERRIVLATNIAETSLTIPNVTAVIDSGLAKIAKRDPSSDLDRLELRRISKRSAVQRAGRAGRTAPGRVIRLWTEVEHRTLDESDKPEIARVDLSAALLQLLAFHPGDPREFAFFEAPPTEALETALTKLEHMGAISRKPWSLTAWGKRISQIPAHPRLASIVLRGVDRRTAQLAAGIAAVLEARRPPRSPGGTGRAPRDLAERVATLDMPGADRELLAARDQFSRAAGNTVRNEPPTRDVDGEIGRLLLSGFADRVCARDPDDPSSARMVQGTRVELLGAAQETSSELFIALDARFVQHKDQRRARVTELWPISLADLESEAGHLLATRRTARFDPTRKAVICLDELVFSDLPLASRPSQDADSYEIALELARQAARRPQQWLKLDAAAASLQARITFARQVDPEWNWPDVGTDAIVEKLEELCLGKRTFMELQKTDWVFVLRGWLDFPAARRLDDQFPTHIKVPSGRLVPIDYGQAVESGKAPVLAVKLQEMFGLAETPCIVEGKVPLILHLLAPNGRPVQVTSDLRSFWSSTYHAVRKELKGRYPKHPWPDDPWNAPPTRKTNRQSDRN